MKEKTDVLSLAEKVIMQTHYSELAFMHPDEPDEVTRSIDPGSVTCLFRITELVYNRTEDTLEKVTTILNSLHSSGASCLLLIHCRNGQCELYLGAVNKQRYGNVFFLNTIRDVLRNGVEGNLPGTEIEEIFSRKDIEKKIRETVDNGFDSQCITAVSCVSGDREDNSVLPYGIERLFEAAGNKNFSIMLLADPVSSDRIQLIRQGYEELGSELSSLGQNSVSVQTGKSRTLSSNYSVTTSQSIGENISLTQSHTEGNSWSRSKNGAGNKAGRLLASGVGVMMKSHLAMSAMSTLLNVPGESESGHADNSESRQTGTSVNRQTGEQKGQGESVADSEGVTVSATSQNYHIKSLIERIDWYLSWLNRRENYGMFNACAYVISSNAGTNMMVASEYQALMQGKRDMNQPVTFNTFTRENDVETVRGYLLHLSHPAFGIGIDGSGNSFTPGMLLSSKELSRHMALPQRSVIGVPVSEYAPFGREVVRRSVLRSGKLVRVGTVSHMGKADPARPVLLDLQSLAAHTFIAGTNGSGKSNAVFRIIEELMRLDVPFLVVEPAKGEYKNVFGRDKNVSVYGTNEKKTPLLRLNPFWFNEDVNILEHIDKLIEVFNASWSMYAAMPAVLKAAIENAYKTCGWDLSSSECRGGVRIFPTFEDVLAEFNGKMDSTAFSQEVKGNYVGALSTRMETMTNGLYGKIFGGANLTDEQLFDTNVVIDLSRVGSVETKSMLMGMLVIRLQEYRMKNEAMNLPLQHVTILEEAHNLLRRTSTAQSDEGSNVLGKSVEMISGAIAEMRSFGEGFVIIDQSPGLLDMSVMRNTNTKIVLRLPEGSDRELAGNTMGLRPEQIYEISRFGTGTAVIYQKDWREAVLCRIDRASHEEELYHPPVHATGAENRELIRVLASRYCPDASVTEEETREAEKEILTCALSGREKKRVMELLTSRSSVTLDAISNALTLLAGKYIYQPLSPEAQHVRQWYEEWMRGEKAAIFGRGAAHTLALAVVNSLAQKEPRYAAAGSLLPAFGAGTADEAIRKARGIAFSAITPLSFRIDPERDKQPLEEAFDALNRGSEADRELALLLRHSIDTGEIRRRRELAPYAGIVWKILMGEGLWYASGENITGGLAEAWDETARKWLRGYITTDRDTESAILSLFLQQKGRQPAVRAFYVKWEEVYRRKERG